ncbi:MAG: NFACT RNA binding domain-containing protein [Acidobacteriota bacterium]
MSDRLRPTAAQLGRLARELDETVGGGVVQGLRVVGDGLCCLSVRRPGHTHQLGLSFHSAASGPLLLPRRGGRDRDAEAGTNFWQRLSPGVMASLLESVESPEGDRSLLLSLRRGHERGQLLCTHHGRDPDLVWLVDGLVVASLRGRARKGQSLDDLLGSGGRPGRPSPDDAATPLDLKAWSARLAEARTRELATGELETLAQRLREAARKAETRRERREADVEKLGDASDLQREAEALASNLHLIEKGQEQLSLPSWPGDEDPPVLVALDPSVAPAENLRRAWQRHRKTQRGREQAEERLAETVTELATIEECQLEVEVLRDELPEEGLADTLDDLRERCRPLLPKPKVQGKKRKEESALPFKTYLSKDGLPILVGRNASSNDQLSLKIAHGNDLWLHAQGVPGSHVVVRLPKGAEIPQETLLDAATLAHLHGGRKGASSGEVTWTRAKHVTKKKGLAAGQVIVSQEKSVRVRVEEDRVKRLKDTLEG